MLPLAALLLGAAGAVLPAAAAAQRGSPSLAAAPRAQTPQTKPDKPLVMLVCREIRGGQKTGTSVRAADLTCVTRWAGL